jgi:NAD(P)H dehydrogenase (quinone)
MGKILITGASGQLGQLAIKHLLETYHVAASDIVAASRNVEKLQALKDKGLGLRKADFDEPATLDSAFTGIDTVFLISTDALAVKGQRLAQHKAAIDAAKRTGVKRIVYTSMPSPERSPITFASDHGQTEEAIKASGLDYVILRNAWYTDNYLESLPRDLETGKWYTGTKNGKVSNISRDDLGLAAAAVLAQHKATNQTLTLTGVEPKTTSEIAQIVSQITGKPLEVVDASEEQMRAGMQGAGLPDFIVDMLLSFDEDIAQGNMNIASSDFEDVTGRKPQSVEDFLKANKDKLIG